MIRIDEIWLSTQPMDMRAGMDTTPYRQLKKFRSAGWKYLSSSLPYRQLRKFAKAISASSPRSLPCRQLKNTQNKTGASPRFYSSSYLFF